MKGILIQSLNSIWLAIIFIGIPAVSSLRLGTLQISSRPVWHMLTLWGVVIALGFNFLVYWKWTRTKTDRKMCLRWMFGYTFLGVTFFAYSEKWIGFKWLKELLLGLKGMFD